MNRLPTSLEAVRGLRAARWTRESTPGQYDAFGPDAQREQQDRAIERWGLADAGLEWLVAHSGRTVGSTAQFADMLATAGVDYDVLVVGYVSRFARNLRTAVNARHDLHAAGAAFLFADERLLSSDEEQWEAWAREAVEAEAYSRRLGKRIREGYGAKRRRFGVPGGNRPPLGTARDGRDIVVEPEGIATVRRAYELAAAGLTDREVAQAVGLRLKHVAEILTNPFYAGRLWRGEPSALGPLVDLDTWERVQEVRARFSRRSPGRPARHHLYALSSLLFCGACGRRLTGHVGRYRHVDACLAFTDARPRFVRRYSNASDRRTKGESYPAQVYEGVVPQFLAQVALGARTRADAIALATAPENLPPGDPLALARIGREREAATSRYLRERDIAALEAAMARLDSEETAARGRPRRSPTAGEAVAYLQDLPRLWRETDDEGRRALATSLFERIDVLGTAWARGKLTPDAEAAGVAAAWLGPIRCSMGSYGRGERTGPEQNQLIARHHRHHANEVLRAAPAAAHGPGESGWHRFRRSARQKPQAEWPSPDRRPRYPFAGGVFSSARSDGSGVPSAHARTIATWTAWWPPSQPCGPPGIIRACEPTIRTASMRLEARTAASSRSPATSSVGTPQASSAGVARTPCASDSARRNEPGSTWASCDARSSTSAGSVRPTLLAMMRSNARRRTNGATRAIPAFMSGSSGERTALHPSTTARETASGRRARSSSATDPPSESPTRLTRWPGACSRAISATRSAVASRDSHRTPRLRPWPGRSGAMQRCSGSAAACRSHIAPVLPTPWRNRIGVAPSGPWRRTWSGVIGRAPAPAARTTAARAPRSRRG